MITKTVVTIATETEIPLGYQGENKVREIVFPQPAELLRETWTLFHRRQGDETPYPVPLEVGSSGLVWTVTSGDTANRGGGRAQLVCTGPDGEILKTAMYRTVVSASMMENSGEPPDPVVPWYDAIMDAIASGGGGGSGEPGADGGYYRMEIQQVDEDTMTVAYVPSKPDMPPVEPVTVALPAGPQGERGLQGDPATLNSSKVEYQVSESGTIIPSGVWSTSVPVVAQGKYLWTRTTQNYNTGDPVVSYSVGRMGLDGAGSVSSVAGISPDSSGNVPLTADDVGALPSSGGDITGELKMNGQPISGLNPPTEDTQATNKGYVDAQARKAAPVNLLDNSDFRNPVNQRGANSYTLDAWGGYTIDRWAAYASGCTVTASNDGIQLNGELYQPISKETAHRYNGKTVTIAAKIGGNVYCAHGVVNQAGSYNVPASVDTPYGKLLLTCEGTNTLFFAFRNNTSAVVEWAALYEGEYTAETLPEYQPKGYAVELAECQRYFQRIDFSWQILAVASPRTAATTRSGVILPQMPRISAPTCTYSGSNAVLASTEGNKIITELKPVAQGNIMRIECTAESVTAGMPYAIYGNSSSEYIDISADL